MKQNTTMAASITKRLNQTIGSVAAIRARIESLDGAVLMIAERGIREFDQCVRDVAASVAVPSVRDVRPQDGNFENREAPNIPFYPSSKRDRRRSRREGDDVPYPQFGCDLSRYSSD